MSASGPKRRRVSLGPLLHRVGRPTGDALDRVGNDRRMALLGVRVQLNQRDRLPVTLTARHELRRFRY
jgi:hypothetical protein